MNEGFSVEEINKLRQECKELGQNFAFVEDEDELIGDEYVHFQFVGMYEGKDVIYDAVMTTLRLHYSSTVYETALSKATKIYPLYVPHENRDETYKADEELDEEVELLIMELIEEIEENDEVKVTEHVQLIKDFEYGVGMDISLNRGEINEQIISKFVDDFNKGALSLDSTLYSFKEEDEQ
jgi:hypothetical protein